MNHEEELIKAFFASTKKQRYLEFLAKPNTRRKFLRELVHFKSLDPTCCFTLPKGVHTTEEIAEFLRRKGAPPDCWVTSEFSAIDSKEMPLVDALQEIIGRGMGTFLSCIPGKLAYFENEDGRWILERATAIRPRPNR